METKESRIVIEFKPIIHTHIMFATLGGQIHGQVSVCHTWNALPNKVEDKVVAIA